MSNSTLNKLKNLPLPHMAKQTKNMHFCLIIPPSPFVVPRGWEWVHTAPFEGPSIVASIIKGLGFKFTLLDQRENKDVNNLKDKLDNYDIIGISTFEDAFPYIKKAIAIAKDNKPDRPVILGGSLVSSIPKTIMNNTEADFAVCGEAELTLIELLDYLSNESDCKPLKHIDGLVWKTKAGELAVNNKREQLTNLDSIPFQDFSVWKRFKDNNIPEIYLSTSRGCHRNCSFCYKTMPKIAYKTPNKVKKEIEYLKKYNFKHAWINDLSFTHNSEHILKLMEKAFSTYNFSWNCFARVSEINTNTLKAMKTYGCDIILYGFEAISQAILDSFNKGITKNDMLNAINLTKEAKIKVGGLFIIGNQNETKQTLSDIMEFVQQHKDITRVKYLSIIPGTQLYREALKEGIIKDELAHLDFLSREQSIEEDIDEKGFIFMPKQITKEELRNAYRFINNKIELRPYEYWEKENIYLKKPEKFIRRI